MATFTVQEGYDKRIEIPIPEGEFIIGRDPHCDYVISAGNVSRRHAKVSKKGNRVYIEDLNSQNGTFVNSTPISQPTLLKHLDIVQIGRNMFVFNDTDTPVEMQPGHMEEGMKTTEYYTFDFVVNLIQRLENNIKLVFKGKPKVIRNVIVCLFADGHLLIEDVPGVGKSVLAQALAKSIQGNFKRIQFTPDMLPSDITGLSVYNEKTKEFNFIPGPIFGNIILADEINRTTPRTQSALLECMAESKITIDGKSHVLPKPFFVIATQNPSDFHGTYPLPEPQLDRFLMAITIGYPDMEAEKEILSSQEISHPLTKISYVVNAMEIVQCQAIIRKVYISDEIKEYIIRIVDATRKHHALNTGCSPRASLALMRASQSLAAYYRREYVLPRDVRELAPVILAHRVSLKLSSQGEWQNTRELIEDVLQQIPVDEKE